MTNDFGTFLKKNGLTEKEDVKKEWTAWKTDKSVVLLFRAKGEMGQTLDQFESASENFEGADKIIEKYGQTGRTVRISMDYAKQLLKLMTKTKGDSLVIKVDNDYPVFFGTDDFEVIIAPRVEA